MGEVDVRIHDDPVVLAVGPRDVPVETHGAAESNQAHTAPPARHLFIFEGLRAKHRSPKAALFGLADCMSVMGETPAQVAHSLAFLQIDLTDPEFHQHAYSGSIGFHAGLCALIKDGIAAGEFIRCDASRLARALQATLNGSMLGWAIHREGPLAAWIRRDLRVVLHPYCT